MDDDNDDGADVADEDDDDDIMNSKNWIKSNEIDFEKCL